MRIRSTRVNVGTAPSSAAEGMRTPSISRSPSLSLGMNSPPRPAATGTLTATSAIASSSATTGRAMAAPSTGR